MDTSSSSASASASSLSSSSPSGAAAQLALAQSERLASLSLSPPEVAALSATGVLVEPYLDGYATSNVTTQIGTHAYLPCRVSSLHSSSLAYAAQIYHNFGFRLVYLFLITSIFIRCVFSSSVPILICNYCYCIAIPPLLSLPSKQAIGNTLYFIA